jgi:hypothetical protein
MRDHKFRHSDLTARKSSPRLRKVLFRVVAFAVAVAVVYVALRWLWPNAEQPGRESDSNIIPLTLPPKSKAAEDGASREQ